MTDYSALLDSCVKESKFVTDLKPQQRTAITELLGGKDVLAVLPTGFGKSLIYQLFFCVKRKQCDSTPDQPRPLIFVVSPLKSIVTDQIKDFEELNVRAASFSGDKALEDLDSKLEVLFGSAEQFLAPKFLAHLRGSELLQNRLQLIVIDECHTVETWGKRTKKGKKMEKAFRAAFAELASLRSFSDKGVPVLALTGTANLSMMKVFEDALALKKGYHKIHLSPERVNIRYSVIKAKRQVEFTHLTWLIEMIKENGTETPKTIIFCSTMTSIANVLGYLLSKLGTHAYSANPEHLPSSRLIGLYHSMTLDKNKARVCDSFKNNKGNVRVVIASSALSMGVNFKDIRYVIHIGPSRSLVDHVQESGRAGRDGELSHNLILFHGQRLAQCNPEVKDFVKATGCFRQALFNFFDVSVDSVTPAHNCCSNCAIICKCGTDGCDGEKLPFEKGIEEEAEVSPEGVREVSQEEREVLEAALKEYRMDLEQGTSALFDPANGHGLSDQVIEYILSKSHQLFTLDDMVKQIPFFSVQQALSVLEIFHEIFEDIPSCKDILVSLPAEVEEMRVAADLFTYFDESDTDSDNDVLNNWELDD